MESDENMKTATVAIWARQPGEVAIGTAPCATWDIPALKTTTSIQIWEEFGLQLSTPIGFQTCEMFHPWEECFTKPTSTWLGCHHTDEHLNTRYQIHLQSEKIAMIGATSLSLQLHIFSPLSTGPRPGSACRAPWTAADIASWSSGACRGGLCACSEDGSVFHVSPWRSAGVSQAVFHWPQKNENG